jgi:hypothetical protein
MDWVTTLIVDRGLLKIVVVMAVGMVATAVVDLTTGR